MAVVLMMFCVGVISASASSQATEMAVTNSFDPETRVAVYSEPSISSKLIGEYFNGVSVEVLEHVSDEWVKMDIHTFGTGGNGYVMAKDIVFGDEADSVVKTTIMYVSINDYFILDTHPFGQSGEIGPFGKGESVELLGLVPWLAYEEGIEITRPLDLDGSKLHLRIGDVTGFLADFSVLQKVDD